MKDKFLGIFDKRPLIWFHYVLLTGILFIAFFSASMLGIVNQFQQLPPTTWVILFVWYFLFITIGDTIIHRGLNLK